MVLSIRFKGLTFPIIRGHQFAFNSERYFTGNIPGRLHRTPELSLVVLQKLIVHVVFVAVVVKDFPRMYEEDAVSKCLSRLIREIDHLKRQLYLLVEEI